MDHHSGFIIVNRGLEGVIPSDSGLEACLREAFGVRRAAPLSIGGRLRAVNRSPEAAVCGKKEGEKQAAVTVRSVYIRRRMLRHKSSEEFCKRYGVTNLVRGSEDEPADRRFICIPYAAA
jgi:hypothetical protein